MSDQSQRSIDDSVTVRRADANEYLSLATFARACFVDTYTPLCNPADVGAYVRDHLNDDAFLRAVGADTNQALVAERVGEWAGFAHVRRASIPLHVPPVGAKTPVELVRFYVARDHHGKGVAQALLDYTVQTLLADGSDTLWLTVWQENPRAISFYRKMGFRFVGTANFTMGTEVQDDFIMLRALSDLALRQPGSL